MESIICSLVTAAIPAIVTLITFYSQTRLSKKHAAKQSILQMILEDQLNWELFRKFPTNYGTIQDEYSVYHDNGGNGEVTKKVHDYNKWFEKIESDIAKGEINGKGKV